MVVFAQEQMGVFAIAHHIDSGRHPLTCFRIVPNTPYSTTLLRNVSRSFFRVSSTSATASGGIQPVSPIHWKNFLNEAIFDLTLVAEAHIALRGNQFAKKIQTSPLLVSSSFFNVSSYKRYS